MSEPYNKVYRKQRFTIEVSAMVPPETDQATFRKDWLCVIREHLADRSTDSFTIQVSPRRSAKWYERLHMLYFMLLVGPWAYYYGSHHP